MLSSFRCEPCVALGVDSLMAFQRGDCDEQWLCVFQEKIASCLSYLLWVFVVQMLDTTKSNKPESLTPQSFSEVRKWSEPSESEVSRISPSPRRQRFQKPSAVSITNIAPSFVRSRVVVYLTVTDRLRYLTRTFGSQMMVRVVLLVTWAPSSGVWWLIFFFFQSWLQTGFLQKRILTLHKSEWKKN